MTEPSWRSTLGVHVYGAAAMALGVIGLTWGDFATIWQPVPETVPHRRALAYLAAAGLLIAGSAVHARRTRRHALVALAVLYLPFALLWLRRVVRYPLISGTWSGFAEEFVLVIAAAMACAAFTPPSALSAPSAARMTRTTRGLHAGRVLFGLCALSFGVTHFTALKQTAAMVPTWVPPDQRFWAMTTGAAMALAGVAIGVGIYAVLAARLLTALIVSFGVFVWAPSLVAQPHDHVVWAGNAINLAIAGAAWIVADVLHATQTGTWRSIGAPSSQRR